MRDPGCPSSDPRLTPSVPPQLLSLTSTSKDITSATSIPLTATFSQPVTSLALAAFDLGSIGVFFGATLSNLVATNSSVYTLTLNAPNSTTDPEGLVLTVQLPAASVVDLSNNDNLVRSSSSSSSTTLQ